MEVIVIMMILLFLVFGSQLEKLADKYIETVYESHANRDALKTHIAIYGFAYWMGMTSFACLLSALQNAHSYPIMTIASLFTFIFCAKITRLFYTMATAREKVLVEYLK